MIYIVIIFLLVSVYLYCLLGGADFGAGIIELTSSKKNREYVRKLTSEAIAPIWEANHMWLIITVVILFMGFPSIYSQVSVSLYIPLILLLIGIVLRGTAFTFRQYDAVKDFSQEVYSRVFSYSSLMVSFFFGLIVGAVVSGKIMINPPGFFEGYIYPWLNLFSICVGIFISALFAFVAAVFLIGDTTDEKIRSYFIKKSKYAIIAMVISGGLVFISSLIEKVTFTEQFINTPLSIGLIILATIELPLHWYALSNGLKWFSRITAGALLIFILGAFYAVYFPVILHIKDGKDLTLYNSAAPDATLSVLGWALLIGSLIIFPALFYLYKVFKLSKK